MVASPLQIIFQDCINFGIFPDCWKYANVQPIHKKIAVKLSAIIDLFRYFVVKS